MSVFHHPLIALLSGVLMLLVVLPKLAKGKGQEVFFGRYMLGFILLSMLDATVTGGVSKLDGVEGTAWFTGLTFIFVLGGDWRYFLLLWSQVWQKEQGGPRRKAWVISLALMVVPTLVSGGIELGFAEAFAAAPRLRYLAYELVMVVLAALMLGVVIPRAFKERPKIGRWMNMVTSVVLVHYVGWASADVVILLGHEVGHLLRVIPNVTYYALFLPAVWFCAPDDVRQRVSW